MAYCFTEEPGHVSFYPKYFPRKKRQRNLAIYDGNVLTVSHTGEVFYPQSHEEYCEIAVKEHLDIYMGDPSSYPWLDDALKYTEDINVSRSRGIASITHKIRRDKRTTRTLGLLGGGLEREDGKEDGFQQQRSNGHNVREVFNSRQQGKTSGSKGWGVDKPGSTFINALTCFFDDYGYGIHPTPGALGNAALVEFIRKEGKHRISRPNAMLRNDLLKHNYGGRADEPLDRETTYKELVEDDISSAYPAASRWVPDPRETPKRHFGDPNRGGFFTWYSHVIITIPGNVPRRTFGPMPIRERGSDSKIQYPTRPGKYDNWLWREEIQNCIDCGYEVEYKSSWCWDKGSSFMAGWAEEIFALIQRYKAEPYSEEREMKIGFAKAVSVALPGRMIMHPEKLTIVTDYQPGDQELLYHDNKELPFTGYYVRSTPDPDANHLTQVGSWIIKEVRCRLWERMEAYRSRGVAVLSTNFDALYTVSGGLDYNDRRLGGWKRKALKGIPGVATMPERRTLNTREKVRRPGRKKTS